ncbi:hypothetical protein GCM10027578_29120 [Spirosoma luteolum]
MQDAIEQVRSAELPINAKTFSLTSAQIKDKESVKNLARELMGEGSHIYWFEVDKPKELVERFNAQRSEKPAAYKMARDNKGTDSRFIYVGSCTRTKLGERFKQHCGFGNAHTYSLQLARWIDDSDLTITFSHIKLDDKDLVSLLEEQLHRELKPLFGKPGANNKLTKK